MTLDDLFDPSGKEKIGDDESTPIMSITMHGLIDQTEKFKKRVASASIADYKKVYWNELVVGFPIDEGVIGFQTKYDYAAVSPAYKIWKLKRDDVDITFLGLLLRSNAMRQIYNQISKKGVDRRRLLPDDTFRRITVPIPSRVVQREIVKRQNEIEKRKIENREFEQRNQEQISTLWH